MSERVKTILGWYEGENPGTKGNLYRLLMQGQLAGTGKLVILPVDQGYEHGPARSFSKNPAAYDPHYLYQLAIDAGLTGYAAPLGPLEQGADTFAGQIPTILKLNSANSLHAGIGDQAITGSVKDALRLGCVGVGFTIYPGSEANYGMMEEFRELSAEAKANGLVSVLWAYPRGGNVSKEGETALDIVAYAAHMAALLGATIIKVKPPKAGVDLKAAQSAYEGVPMETMKERIAFIACFRVAPGALNQSRRRKKTGPVRGTLWGTLSTTQRQRNAHGDTLAGRPQRPGQRRLRLVGAHRHLGME